MSEKSDRIIVASMNAKAMGEWKKETKYKRITKKSWTYLSAIVLCLSVGTYFLSRKSSSGESAMTTGFEYDETLGRLQYVSNILPESAMVFLTSEVDAPELCKPTESVVVHAWSQAEPWLEYEGSSDVISCSSGEVMTVVKNRADEYTVRIMHSDGYESIYSGLTTLAVKESDSVLAGDVIGTTQSATAFEWRKDGLSILPVFKPLEDNK